MDRSHSPQGAQAGWAPGRNAGPSESAGRRTGDSDASQGPAVMAPKSERKIVKQLAVPLVVSKSEVVKLEDISTADDSGWRDVDRERVDELKEIFMRGDYGQNILGGPMIVHLGDERNTLWLCRRFRPPRLLATTTPTTAKHSAPEPM